MNVILFDCDNPVTVWRMLLSISLAAPVFVGIEAKKMLEKVEKVEKEREGPKFRSLQAFSGSASGFAA